MKTPSQPQTLAGRFAYVSLDYLRALRAGAVAFSEPDVWAARAQGTRAGDIAVIPIYGMITQRGSWMGTSLEAIRLAHRTAMADPSVAGIVYEYDSPGGEVYGVEELAAEFRADRDRKPSVAVANALSASAAYYLMAQHREVLVTPSGEIGSIGVYGIHMDWSRALDEMGITVSIVSAGEGKVDGNPFQELGKEARAEMQADIDRYYSMFTSAAAKGRGVEVARIRSDWKAKVYGAKEAVAIGMADAVGTLDDAVRRAGKLVGERRAASASADTEAERRLRARSRI